MDREESFACLLFLILLLFLNLFFYFIRNPSLERKNYRNALFVEIKEDGKSKVIRIFPEDSMYLKIEERCGNVINGMSISKKGCGIMSAYKRISLGIPISINREDTYGLCAIPGIGPHIAERIISYRNIHGRFNSIEEMMKVKGIGKRLYKKIRPFIKL